LIETPAKRRCALLRSPSGSAERAAGSLSALTAPIRDARKKAAGGSFLPPFDSSSVPGIAISIQSILIRSLVVEAKKTMPYNASG
jgi:hypothetical protein